MSLLEERGNATLCVSVHFNSITASVALSQA